MLFVYHHRRRLVQRNEPVTVKLYRGKALCLRHGVTDVVPVKRFPVLIAIVAALLVSSMSVLSGETAAQTPGGTSGDAGGKFGGSGNESPALQQSSRLDPAAATQAWLDSVPRDKREKSDAYFEGGYWLLLWNYLVAAGISIFLLSSRISARLRRFLGTTNEI